MAVASAALLAVGLSAVVTAAGAAEQEPIGHAAIVGGYPVWAHFNAPQDGADGAVRGDNTIQRELVRLIDNAPAASNIKGAIHSLSLDYIADALVRARDRAVDVQLVVDGKNDVGSDNPAVAKIRGLAYFCHHAPTGNACISTSASGDMHTKMFTFTATTAPDGTAQQNVSWFGSPNMTTSSGPKMFNNAITVYGDAALTNGLNANFADLKSGRHYNNNDYYDAAAKRGYYPAGAADVYASPEAVGQTDTIVARFNDIKPDAQCRVRIGMATITGGRPQLVSQVKSLKAGGCKVWMTVGTSDTGGIDMSKSVYDGLIGAGVLVKRVNHVHDKFFMAYGKVGTAYQYRVYTGSQNWTQDALNGNDEIFVKMAPEFAADHRLYDAYYEHFRDMYDRGNGTTCTAGNYPCT